MVSNVVILSAPNMLGNTTSPQKVRVVGDRARTLTEAEHKHTEKLFSLFSKHMSGTRASGSKTVKLALQAIRAFFNYVGRPPWEWEESDLADFISYKVREADIGVGRQATYITYLRAFQNYVLNDRGLSNEIHKLFAVQFQRFVSDTNAIPIKRKRHERKKIVRPLSGTEVQRLLEEIDSKIESSRMVGTKALKTLRRDKVIISLMLMSGIRVEEVVKLTISSFRGDPRYPQYGDYALLTVIGKGNKTRVVRMYNPDILHLMTWYMEEVRPGFLSTRTQDPTKLFMSERGCGLCTEQIRRSLKNLSADAGIQFRVHPHALRHTYGTQMANIIGPQELQQQLGHEYLSTTLGTYYHDNPEEVGNRVAIGVENMIQALDSITKEIDNEN